MWALLAQYLIPSAGKIRSHTLQEDQEFEPVFLPYGNISLDIRLTSLKGKYDIEIYTLSLISSSESPVRAVSASILAPKSPTPPIDSGP